MSALCLYDDFDDLLSRLRRMLAKPAAAPAQLREHVARYDWQNLIGHYDDMLAMLGKRGARRAI
jgi:hypothetical protein